MKKTFVRILAFLLVLCMSFSMTACGAKDQPEDTPAAPSEEASANPSAQPESGSEEREHVELIFYTHANAIFAGYDKTMAAVNEYLKEKLNTTVDFRIYDQSTYKDTVNPAFMSGDEMDCLLVGSTGIDFVTNVSKNAFIDISSYIDTYLPGTKARLPEAAWEAYSYQGGIYGICSIKDLANQLGIYTNDTLLNDLGIEFPADTYYTWKDLVPFFYEVQAASTMNSGYPIPATPPCGGRMWRPSRRSKYWPAPGRLGCTPCPLSMAVSCSSPATRSTTPKPWGRNTGGIRRRDCPSPSPKTITPTTTTPSPPSSAGAATPTCSSLTGSITSCTRPCPTT